MARYEVDHPWFARFYQMSERLVEALLAQARSDQNRRARGRTLIIGAGTGLDVPYLGAEVSEVVLLEPDATMRRALKSKYPDALVVASSAEDMALGDGEFDTVLTSLVLCSVHDVSRTLEEIVRVLRPHGQYLFLEHVASPYAAGAMVQHWADPIWQRVGGGCHLTRDLENDIRRSRLVLEECQTIRSGWVFPVIAGRAVKKPE